MNGFVGFGSGFITLCPSGSDGSAVGAIGCTVPFGSERARRSRVRPVVVDRASTPRDRGRPAASASTGFGSATDLARVVEVEAGERLRELDPVLTIFVISLPYWSRQVPVSFDAEHVEARRVLQRVRLRFAARPASPSPSPPPCRCFSVCLRVSISEVVLRIVFAVHQLLVRLIGNVLCRGLELLQVRARQLRQLRARRDQLRVQRVGGLVPLRRSGRSPAAARSSERLLRDRPRQRGRAEALRREGVRGDRARDAVEEVREVGAVPLDRLRVAAGSRRAAPAPRPAPPAPCRAGRRCSRRPCRRGSGRRWCSRPRPCRRAASGTAPPRARPC